MNIWSKVHYTWSRYCGISFPTSSADASAISDGLMTAQFPVKGYFHEHALVK